MDARDLAATVRRVLDELCDEATLGIDEDAAQDAVAATCLEGQAALAALVKQAEDAQIEVAGLRESEAEWQRRGDRANAAEARAVRAEEALRRNENDWSFVFNLAPGLLAEMDERVLHALAEANLRVIREALAAAGADTEREHVIDGLRCWCNPLVVPVFPADTETDG